MENQTPETPNQEVSLKSSRFPLIPVLLSMLVILLVAVGYLWYQNQQLKKELAKYLPTPTPRSQESPVPSNDPTSNWKTYTNTKLGFNFKYPDSWIINTDGEKGQDGGKNISIKLQKNDAKIQIYANMDGIGGLGRDYQGTPIKIDGNNLYKYKSENTYDNTQIVGITDRLTESLGVAMISGKTYSFTLHYPTLYSQEKSTNIEHEFDQILSTFKFMDTSPTPISKACTMEAKLCPDGSSVGRTGPNCEFAPCP